MSSTSPPIDFAPLRTADGSLTLHSAQWNESYHSVHGAVQESTHVFIKAGLVHLDKAHAEVLEVGLGTGLNLLLTWVRCLEGKLTVDYTALEPHPLSRVQLETLAYCEELAWPGLNEPYLKRMTSASPDWHEAIGGLRFRKLDDHVQQFSAEAAFDVVYFDAFAPRRQPEMWTADILERMYRALRPCGVLVTYCAKGEVRRTMQAVGFNVERLQGPPGKSEMLRATKPMST
jgi:tRNA U34 5-methylaminomethyl-2-thiouridine-forming methyltransferase MnmC